jgi:hypothetical protein
MFTRKPRLQLEKFAINGAKRLLQHNPSINGHQSSPLEGPLSAVCGRLRVDKDFLHVCSIGRCSHVFGL